MGLVYKRSTKKDATRYARTPGMVPNPGVAALTVINPGRPPRRRRTSRSRTTPNPYQWVEGAEDQRGRRRRKLPKRTTRAYKTQSQATTRGGSRATERSRLYVVDDLGNILCPVNKEKKMKRNRGVRRNDASTHSAIMAAAGLGTARQVKRRKQTSKPKTSTKAKKAKTSRAKTSKPKTSKRRSPRRASAKLKRRRIFLTGIPEIDRQLERGQMPLLVSVPKKGKKGRPRTTAFVSPRYTRSMRSLHSRVTKKRPRYKKRMEPVEVSSYSGEDFDAMTKAQLIKYAKAEGITVDPKASKDDIVDAMEATFGTSSPIGTRQQWSGGWMAANRGRRRTSRTSARTRARRATGRRRASKRRARGTTKRRTSRRASRRTTRNGRRRTSAGRRSYGVRVLNNPRAILPRRRRAGKKRAGHALYHYTPLGPKTSKRRKTRSIPVLLAPQVIEYAEVRRIGPPKRKKKTTGVAANRRRRTSRRRTSMRKNARRRRTSRRNRTTANRGHRRSSRTTANRRRSSKGRRRRVRRNPGMGMAALQPRALWTDVGRPVLGGGVGFLGARALGSAAQSFAPLQGAVGDPWARAVGNTLGILATLVASAKVPMVRQNRGPLIVGMGIALLDNVISALGGEGGPLSFLSGPNIYSAGLLGSYVDVGNAGSPYRGMMGEYVEYSPVSGMGAYVTSGQDRMMGEYIEQGVSGMGGAYAEGIDPSDAATIEGMIDLAEAQAAAGLYEAAAGVGEVYEAAAGFGTYEALAAAPIWKGPSFGSRMTAYQRSQVPEVSTIQPPMPARPITADLPVEIPITESLATPEGRGHAGGIFGANLFAPMASC